VWLFLRGGFGDHSAGHRPCWPIRLAVGLTNLALLVVHGADPPAMEALLAASGAVCKGFLAAAPRLVR